jgi:hypothetical protein
MLKISLAVMLSLALAAPLVAQSTAANGSIEARSRMRRAVSCRA